MQRIFTLILLTLGLASANAMAGEYNEILNIGDPMPTFNKLPTVSGKPLSADELKADVVVLVSLANHCPWVQGGDPDLIQLVDEFKDKNVRIVGFAVNDRDGDRLPGMKKHAAEHGYNFTYAYDASQELGRDLGATRTPEFFVFNKDRKLVYMGLLHDSPTRMSGDERKRMNGDPSEFYVRDAINATLAGKTVETPETRAHGCSVKYK